MARSRSLKQVFNAKTTVKFDIILFNKKKKCIFRLYLLFTPRCSMDIQTPERGKYKKPVSLKSQCVNSLCKINKYREIVHNVEAAALMSPSKPHINNICNYQSKAAKRWNLSYYILSSASKCPLSNHFYT